MKQTIGSIPLFQQASGYRAVSGTLFHAVSALCSVELQCVRFLYQVRQSVTYYTLDSRSEISVPRDKRSTSSRMKLIAVLTRKKVALTKCPLMFQPSGSSSLKYMASSSSEQLMTVVVSKSRGRVPQEYCREMSGGLRRKVPLALSAQ